MPVTIRAHEYDQTARQTF